LGFFTGIIRVITIILGILAVLILAVLFSMIANSRKKEFAVMRIVGATRKKLAGIVLSEALIVSLCGSILGSLIAALTVYPFGSYIGFTIGLPFLLPSLAETFGLIILGLIMSIIIGPLFASYSAFKISRAETYATMREGE
ncbi:MAG: FtsX-like permease family protein, partial [Treponema sp.]|nr:FtsX-like permease family protein [Treponema sp.]